MSNSLRFRLLLFSATAVMLPALVISIVQRRISSESLKNSIEQEQRQLTRRIANGVDEEIRHTQKLVAMTAHSSFFSAGSRIDQYETFHNLMDQYPGFQELMLVSGVGDEIMKVSRTVSRPRLMHRTEDIRQSFIGDPFFSANRSPTILIGEPLRSFSNPTRQGAVLAKISFTSLGTLMRQAQIGPRGEAFIVHEKGMLLAHPDEQQVFAHRNRAGLPVVKEWMAHPLEPTGLCEYTKAGGVPMIAMAYPIPLLKSAVIVQQPRADVYAPLIRMRNQFILWTLLFVTLFMSLAIGVAWRILEPLRRLRAAAEQVGRGKRDVQLNIHTHDELEEVGRAFENMTRSLAELEQMRQDLINMVVHDLKMPLATILPSLDCLITNEVGPLSTDQTHFLQIAHRSAHEMLLLIQNLLDVAKMEEGKLTLYKDVFAPGVWAQGVLSNFQPLALSNRKHLGLVIARELSPVEGDPTLLGRVLGNLVSNALRHTVPETGEVVVTLYRDGSSLGVQVRDNGEGIPLEDQQRIFEKFVQAGKHTSVRTGTGLGLTFCKMVVEAHGGRITVSSVPKQGTCFTFHLPFFENVQPLPETKAAAPITQSQPTTV
ncbi:MAG: sensor histidine kinase [Elusimicrobiota bacterium]|jgi:signal transduction histidine kinase